MNLNPYNLERSRVPKRRIPWWIYAGSVVLAGLLVWAVIQVLPRREPKSEIAQNPVVEEPVAPSAVVTPAPAPASPPAAVVKPEAPTTKLTAPTTPAASPSVTSPSLQQAQQALREDDYLRARELALAVWSSAGDAGLKQEAEGLLNEVGIGLVMSPRPMPEKVDYTVQPGDSLEKIAKKHGTTIELIRAGNNIRGSMIRAGDRLRIFNGKFSVSVSKSDNDLVVYLNDQFFKRYRVGTGEYNKTPVGDFVINDRIAQPTWWRPDGKAIPYGDPENLLGTHWLSINVKGYGLHGTWEPDTIGKQASAGCVRMLNDDIEQLFTLLPLGTPVSIRD